MFSLLPLSIRKQVLEYSIPYAVDLRPEFSDIPIEAFSKHPMAFFYLVQHDMDVSILSKTMLSEQNNDEIVRYLLEHPDQIDFPSFCKNPHPKAVQYVLEKIKTKPYDTWSQEIRRSLSNNTHDDIVRYELENSRTYQWPILEFAANPNDIIVTYLLAHPDDIYHWNQFSKNPNKRVIDYLLDYRNHPERRIDWNYFARHDDNRVVTLFLQQPEKTFHHFIEAACANPNDNMVKHLLRNPKRPDNINTRTFFVNTNPMVIEWLLEYMDINKDIISHGPIYNHPDIRVFNRLLSMYPDPKNKLKMVQNPNVFYRHVDTQRREWYLLQLAEVSRSSYGRKKRKQSSRKRKQSSRKRKTI